MAIQTSRASVRVSSPPAVASLMARCSAAWWACGTRTADLGRSYSRREQVEREGALERFISEVSLETEHLPRTAVEQESARRRGMAAFSAFSRAALGFEDVQVQALSDGRFLQIGSEFARAARHYDPGITAAEIYQAARNVWTMVGLQHLLGRPATLTPSVFAYSLLYPYTDNFLDDPAVPAARKAEFNGRLARRLAGEEIPPSGEYEERIYDLVAMIEEQHPRDAHPSVYESLLAIHSAQVRSVGLLARAASPYEVDVLGITLEKGGASVLADGYLVAGDLEVDEAAFLFNYGALLQLADDLQDAEGDARKGLLTVFSQTSAGRWRLDALADRTFQFAEWVFEGMPAFREPAAEPLSQLIRASATWLLLGAVGQNWRLFSKAYVRRAEQHSPFRFHIARAQRERLTRRKPALMRLVDAFAALPAHMPDEEVQPAP